MRPSREAVEAALRWAGQWAYGPGDARHAETLAVEVRALRQDLERKEEMLGKAVETLKAIAQEGASYRMDMAKDALAAIESSEAP